MVGCVLLGAWILVWMLVVSNAFDWEGSGAWFGNQEGESGKNINEDTSRFKLPSYQAASVREYRESVRGLHYGLYTRRPTEVPQSTADAQVRDPAVFLLRDLLDNWDPDDTRPERWETSSAHPDKHAQGVVRRFDFQREEDMALALRYRQQEVPFIVYNVTELDAAVGKFSLRHLLQHFGSVPRPAERSEHNHFLYYSAKMSAKAALMYSDWRAPQVDVPLSFSRFLRLAEQAEGQEQAGALALHYMTIDAREGLHTPWVRDAFPFFDSHREKNFFVVDNRDFKGINCRFGMRGIVQEAHYDGKRNFVAMVRGRKRYVLLPPSECNKLSLFPHGHPSGRHSDVDWSDAAAVQRAGAMGDALATEAVISSGDVLYLPSNWFHYIVSQDATIQCNARSGISDVGKDAIAACMSARLPARSRKSPANAVDSKVGLLLEALANH